MPEHDLVDKTTVLCQYCTSIDYLSGRHDHDSRALLGVWPRPHGTPSIVVPHHRPSIVLHLPPSDLRCRNKISHWSSVRIFRCSPKSFPGTCTRLKSSSSLFLSSPSLSSTTASPISLIKSTAAWNDPRAGWFGSRTRSHEGANQGFLVLIAPFDDLAVVEPSLIVISYRWTSLCCLIDRICLETITYFCGPESCRLTEAQSPYIASVPQGF
jgi:hypothetical protein